MTRFRVGRTAAARSRRRSWSSPLMPVGFASAALASATATAVASAANFDGVGNAGPARALRRLLNDGTSMPMVGLGTWKAPAAEVEGAVFSAICDAGYRHIDAAQIYMNQEAVGQAIHRAMQNCGVKREALWVTTKVWMVDFHPRDVPAAVDRILRELGLDYVDQLLMHWPLAYARPPPGCPPDCPAEFAKTDVAMRPRGADGNMVTADIPLADTWAALEREKAAGKVRSIGVSNFNAGEIARLGGSTLPAVNQVEAHVFWNQAPLLEEMRRLGVAVVAYTPLGNPAIYGDTLEGMASRLIVDVAAEAGLTPAQAMLNFLLAQDFVVLPKSVTPSRIRSNIDFELRLTEAQIARLATEAPQRRLSNPPIRAGGRRVFEDAVLPRAEL